MNFILPAIILASLPLCAATGSAGTPDTPAMQPGAQGDTAPRFVRPPSREQVSMRMMVRQLLLDRYDSNQDAELDADERRRLMEDAHAARKQQALAFIRRFDADGDGKLSPDERATMQQAMEKRRRPHPESTGQSLPPRGDKFPQPPLPPEPAAAEEEEPGAAAPPPPPRSHAGRRGPRQNQPQGPRPPHPRMGKEGRVVAFMVQQLTMDAYDADKNGHLDREESARLREDGAKLYRAREEELLSRYDSNEDGTLSGEELKAALAELLPHRPGHSPRTEGPPPPPRHHRRGHGRNPINRLLDTHFDVDILLNLAHPQATPDSPLPCSPSTPSAN